MIFSLAYAVSLRRLQLPVAGLLVFPFVARTLRFGDLDLLGFYISIRWVI